MVTLSSDKALRDLALAGGSRHAGGKQGEEGEEEILTHLDNPVCRGEKTEQSQLVNSDPFLHSTIGMNFLYSNFPINVTYTFVCLSGNFLFGRAEDATPDFRVSGDVR